MTFQLASIQQAITNAGLDGWLLYDFRRSNPVAHRVLELDPNQMFSRRWFYFIPAANAVQPEPTALISAVEPHVLRELPGRRHVFHTWREMQAVLQDLLSSSASVAMEYSPNNAIPVTSWVDAGTVEFVRSCGVEVVSSGNLAQYFEATLSEHQIATHRQAASLLLTARERLLQWVRERLLAEDILLTEYTVQQQFVSFIHQQGLIFEHAPIVAVNGHAGDPHYETNEQEAFPVRRGDVLLIDFTGRLKDDPLSVIADYTYMAALESQVPDEAAKLFAIISTARDAGLTFLRQKIERHEPVHGYEVDVVVRNVVDAAGYGGNFVHRTGHNIGIVTHGNGANLDNLETYDDRLLLANTCCSVEPGIYLPHIGVRTEVNAVVLADTIEVTGVPAQTEILPLLA